MPITLVGNKKNILGALWIKFLFLSCKFCQREELTGKEQTWQRLPMNLGYGVRLPGLEFQFYL